MGNGFVWTNGTVLKSDDPTWGNAAKVATKTQYSMYGASDGNPLWAAGDSGTILKSADGLSWTAQQSGTSNGLTAVFGTEVGARVWVVGDYGTILESGGGGPWIAGQSGTWGACRTLRRQ